MKGAKLFYYTLLAALFLPQAGANCQEGLHIFGSLQNVFWNEFRDRSLNIEPEGGAAPGFYLNETGSRTTFAVQQLDIFLNNYFSSHFNVFIDLEFKLNYSSDKNWGALNMQEAWVKYSASDAFNLQMGLLFPKFNSFNEIKNKLFLQPYLIRPIIYEQVLSEVMQSEDIIPEKAFLQFTGFFPVGNLRLEYAAYAGNSESSYITTSKQNDTVFEYLSGVDPNNIDIKLVGGRLGVFDAFQTFKAGVSLTHDFDNRRDSSFTQYGQFAPPLGDVERWRIGADAYLLYDDFEIEGEFITVLHDYSGENLSDISLNQHFWYVNVMYNMFSSLSLYGNIQFRDTEGDFNQSTTLSLGSVVKLNDDIFFKLQFANYYETSNVDAPISYPGYGVIRANVDSSVELFFLIAGLSVKF